MDLLIEVQLTVSEEYYVVVVEFPDSLKMFPQAQTQL